MPFQCNILQFFMRGVLSPERRQPTPNYSSRVLDVGREGGGEKILKEAKERGRRLRPLSLPQLSSRPKRSSRGSCCTSSPSLPPSRLGEILALHHKDFPPPSSVSTFPSHLSTHEKPESWNSTRNVKSGGKLASFVSTLIHD